MSSSLSSWLVPITLGHHQDVRLICFPYAGGSASIYKSWARFLPPHIEAFAVQLPGRETRFSEPLVETLGQYIENVTQTILDLKGRKKTILFGHSLGALAAYETAVRLSKANFPLSALAVSGRQSPGSPSKRQPISHLPDSLFIEQMATFEGTPKEVLGNTDLINLLTPMIKRDFALSENYIPVAHLPLDCPVYALGARDDIWLDEHSLEKWRKITSGAFQAHWFEGGHFYLKNQAPELVSYLSNVVLMPEKALK
jgi:medium-chain acyl-[acyl-carrier-protein] hydrolase